MLINSVGSVEFAMCVRQQNGHVQRRWVLGHRAQLRALSMRNTFKVS